jgi:hypothetical protein
MRYTESESDLIEAILYFEYRIEKAMEELLKKHTKLAIADKLNKVREERRDESI